MSLNTLNDRARGLGLGALYEAHMARGEFRDLFDHGSPEWRGTDVAEKLVSLRAFEAAKIGCAELVEHYRETHAGRPEGADILARLPETLDRYRQAGHAVEPA